MSTKISIAEVRADFVVVLVRCGTQESLVPCSPEGSPLPGGAALGSRMPLGVTFAQRGRLVQEIRRLLADCDDSAMAALRARQVAKRLEAERATFRGTALRLLSLEPPGEVRRLLDELIAESVHSC